MRPRFHMLLATVCMLVCEPDIRCHSFFIVYRKTTLQEILGHSEFEGHLFLWAPSAQFVRQLNNTLSVGFLSQNEGPTGKL